MSPAIVAVASSGEVPERVISVTGPQRAGLREVFKSWGRDPAELDWSERPTTSLARLAASVLPALTPNRALSTLILATAVPDATPTTQPSVAVLREHIEHDHAFDLPAAWSITEQGMLAPLTALRIASRRVRRLAGDVVVIAADRTGLHHPATLSVYQEVADSRAVGVVVGRSADPLWVEIAPYARFFALLTPALALDQPDYLVLGGEIDPSWRHALSELHRPTTLVAPGHPVAGVLAEAARRTGRVLLVIGDPDRAQVGIGSVRIRLE